MGDAGRGMETGGEGGVGLRSLVKGGQWKKSWEWIYSLAQANHAPRRHLASSRVEHWVSRLNRRSWRKGAFHWAWCDSGSQVVPLVPDVFHLKTLPVKKNFATKGGIFKKTSISNVCRLCEEIPSQPLVILQGCVALQ